MPNDNVALDPEFEAILREIAAEPGSVLLRVPRPPTVRALFDRIEPLRDSATGLSAAERHLIVVHRNEAAWLLRQAALHEFYDGARTRGVVNRYGSTTHAVPLDKRELARRAGEISAQPDASFAPSVEGSSELPHAAGRDLGAFRIERAREMLVRYLTAPLGNRPSASDLAALSMRLEPTNQARIVASIDLSQSGACMTGIKVAFDILSALPSEEQATRAWECVGVAYVKLGELKQALAAYREGCECSPTAYQAQMNRMMFAIQLGFHRDAVESARSLGEMISPDHPALTWFVERQLQSRLAGEWKPDVVGVALAKSLGDELSQAGRRIANVFE